MPVVSMSILRANKNAAAGPFTEWPGSFAFEKTTDGLRRMENPRRGFSTPFPRSFIIKISHSAECDRGLCPLDSRNFSRKIE